MGASKLSIELYFVALLCSAAFTEQSSDISLAISTSPDSPSKADAGLISKYLDKLAAWLPGLDTLNPSFGALVRARLPDKGSSSEESAPLAVRHSSSHGAPEYPGSNADNELISTASSVRDSGSDDLEGAKPKRQPLPALKTEHRGGHHNATGHRSPHRVQARYRHRFHDASGFNNSMAARDGQPVNATDVSHIANTTDSPRRAEGDQGNSSTGRGQLAKVALMFLIRGDLPHEQTWRLFLESVPAQGQSSQPAWNAMFSLYAHTGLDHEFSPSSLLFGRAVNDRVKVEWGQFSVMQAEINLMREALQESLNEKFVLLSETCIPLYPATLVWAQLISESKSRIHACAAGDDEDRRMTYRMASNMEREGLKREHWRKSGQWIALSRKHAQAVAEDKLISRLFKEECWVDTVNQPIQRFCVSDEHYTPTLLAYLGLDNETDCTGSVTNAWWDGPYFHPRTWGANEISGELINNLRKSNHGFEVSEGIMCNYQDAMLSLQAIFPELGAARTRRAHSRALHQASGGRAGKFEAGRQPNNVKTDLGYRELVSLGRAEEFWLNLAVLFPGSLPWWQYLDELGIDGDLLLPALSSSLSRQARTVLQDGRPHIQSAAKQSAPLQAAQQLLAGFRPMNDTNCPLFARKFAASDAESIALLARNFTHPGAVLSALNHST